MHRWLAIALLAVLAVSVGNAAASDRHQFEFAADLSWILANSELDSWLYRSNGKLRYDQRHDGLRLNRIFLDYKGRITPTLTGELSINMNNDVSEKIDLLEAYLQWRPIPRSEWRLRSKFGIFYPHISLENVDGSALAELREQLRQFECECEAVSDRKNSAAHFAARNTLLLTNARVIWLEEVLQLIKTTKK